MKNIIITLILLTSMFAHCQTEEHKLKIDDLEPDIWLGIWDKDNSSHTINIDTMSYDAIPKYLDFRGTVVEALKWNDSLGENILIQTITGKFIWKDFFNDSSDYQIQDKSELYAYLFTKSDSSNCYTMKWRIYDYVECYGVDFYIGFIHNATTITDIDNNGISEITLPYFMFCKGGMDPSDMKIIMYEGQTKYVLIGSTMIMCESSEPYGGDFSESKNLKNKDLFLKFLIKHWNSNKCEDKMWHR